MKNSIQQRGTRGQKATLIMLLKNYGEFPNGDTAVNSPGVTELKENILPLTHHQLRK